MSFLNRQAVRQILSARKSDKKDRKGRRFNIYLSVLRLNWLKRIVGEEKADQEKFLQKFIDKMFYRAYKNRQMTKKIFDRVIEESS